MLETSKKEEFSNFLFFEIYESIKQNVERANIKPIAHGVALRRNLEVDYRVGAELQDYARNPNHK